MKKINFNDKQKTGFYLPVPFYSQRDNQKDWWRTCNTSACAMVAEYLKPGCINGSDDEYYKIVKQYGDTTDHSTQTAALAELEIKSAFYTNLEYEDLKKQLTKDCPVVIGIAHRGYIEAPQGGHMIVVIGCYKTLENASEGYICNDPWGEGFGTHYDLGYIGERVSYPESSLNHRWLCEGSGSGWGRIFYP